MKKITVRVLQGSPDNEYLGGISDEDRRTHKKSVPIMISDNFGKSIANSPYARIEKAADLGYGEEAGEVEWSFFAPHGDMKHGESNIA